MENEEIDSNASASAFGWDFQCNAAIVLVLKYIKEGLKSVKLEGEKEDIEINFNDGSTIYSQAKSFQIVNEDSNGSEKFKEALRTLNKANKVGNTKALIYVTNNDVNPFGQRDNVIDKRTTIPFSGLSKKNQERWKEYINGKKYNLGDYDNFIIEIIPFNGPDDDNKYKIIRRSLEDFLDDCFGTTNHSKKILTSLQNRFFHNATEKDRNVSLSKKDVVWSIIVVYCQSQPDFIDDDFFENDFDGDNSLKEKVRNDYENIIKSASCKFELASKVYAEFDDYKLTTRKNIKDFIRDKWGIFDEDFSIVAEDSRKMVIFSVVDQILRNRKVITQVERYVGGL